MGLLGRLSPSFPGMPTIRAGHATAFFLYDVAEAIDLPRVSGLIGQAVAARLNPKPATPPYVQYVQPPLAIDGDAVGMGEVQGFRVRFKIFDYGVISVALTSPIPSTWDDLLARGLQWQEDPRLTADAEAFCRRLMERVHPAMAAPREQLLTEDYLVFAVTDLDGAPGADAVLAAHGGHVAQLLRGEREPLSAQERDEVLRHRISYFVTDLVVPTWNAAFVYDTEPGVVAAIEILEYANSQLLEFRYYDGLLDGELARIYSQLQVEGLFSSWFGRRYTRAARQLHALFIDVNELTDKTENALKIAGDIYAARLFGLAAARLGLDHWKANVREKLKTLDDIYRFAVERTAMGRGEFLEATIVLILIFELILFFMGIMK
jgi:hypothetical protein